MLFHRGQTLHAELGRDRTTEVRKANHESSPRRIHSFSKARRSLFSQRQCCTVLYGRDRIVLLMVTWCHACGNSVDSVESATLSISIRTDGLSWYHRTTTRRTRTIGDVLLSPKTTTSMRQETTGPNPGLQHHLHMSNTNIPSISSHVMSW
jgi:hypothetical protein